MINSQIVLIPECKYAQNKVTAVSLLLIVYCGIVFEYQWTTYTDFTSSTDQKRSSSKSPDITPQGGYSTNFGVGLNGGGRGVESHMMLAIFKPLVTRLVQCSKELKTPDNVVSIFFCRKALLFFDDLFHLECLLQNLMCDVRQLMTYVKEAHGGVFRRVALSGLLECATKPNRKERVTQTTRVIK